MISGKKCVDEPKDTKNCAILYTECGYKGTSLKACGEIYQSYVSGPDFNAKSI